MRFIPITDPNDPAIEPFHAVRERDLVGREGMFIAEGETVLRTLVASRHHSIVSALIAEKRAEKLKPLFDAMGEDFVVHTASQDIMDAIAGFHMHRGILALGRRASDANPCALLATLPDRATIVVAVGISNHDNIGGLFRNAAAFGVSAVLLDSGCCDPLYRKAIRVSVGAALTIPFARCPTGIDIASFLKERGFTPLAFTGTGRTPLADLVPPPRAALLFGTEGPGLPESLIAACETVRIEMASGLDSLNVATASGIALHHVMSRHLL
jgi:tRNA G18 (ribose-2'-O)-methylase SpoU